MLNRYNDLCLKLHIIHPPHFKILFTNAQSATHTLANMLIWNTVILEGNKFLEKEDLKNVIILSALSLDWLSLRAPFQDCIFSVPWTFYRYYM